MVGLVVQKYGGTSVADPDRIKSVADHVAFTKRHGNDVVVVVSAMGKTTDNLLSLANQVSDVHPGREMDMLLTTGERISMSLLCIALAGIGVEAVSFTGSQAGIITDTVHTKAKISEIKGDRVREALAEGKVVVVAGFQGVSTDKEITTLGRGGSDYTASLIGAAIEATAIEIWTDVDGMLTADPRVIPGARLIERISFDEAAELAAFGAKVLHPATIAPAVQRGIPVFVFNSRNPQGKGTMIAFDAPRLAVRAIAGKRGTTLVKLRSSRMLLAPGFLRRVFEVFETHRTSVDVVTTSEVSVSVTLDDATNLGAILQDLAAFGDVAVERRSGIVAIVGAGIADGSRAIAEALIALGPIPVYMASLSATGINFTLVIDDEQVVPAMQRLHAAFFEQAS